MEVQIPAKQDYIPLFRLSESVLQALLPMLPDDQIVSLVSNQNWVAFPIPGEETREEIENRSDPHIDLRLTSKSVRIGLRCNTVPSVDKMQNILLDYHLPEKDAIVSSMQKLDGDFQTAVYAKIKEHNWSERADYQTRFQRQTNLLDRAGIEEMFERSRHIREEGKRRMKDEDLPHNPVTPVLDLAYSTVERGNDASFLSKLAQLKPIYETCLKIKTAGSIRAEPRVKKKSRSAIFNCPKCGKEFTKEDARLRKFCDLDGMRIRAVFVYD